MMPLSFPIHRFIVTPRVRTLFRWRWLVLLLGIGVALAAVFSVPASALPARFYISNFRLLACLLLISFFSAILLFVAVHYARRYRQSEYQFDLQRRLTQQLIRRPEWGELTSFVVQFPNTFLPVTRASLYTYDHRGTRFEFAAEWNANGLMSFGRPFEACPACLPTAACKRRNLLNCNTDSQGVLDPDADEYCLPLSYDNLLIGVLKLQQRSGREFSPDQITFLQAIAPQIALALALAIARPREVMQMKAKAQVEERYRTASELHNTVAQQVGYLHFNLDRLFNDERLHGAETFRAELENMRRIADEAYQQIRRMLAHLRASGPFDLPGAIAEHAEKLSQSTNLQIDVTHGGEPKPLPPQVCQGVLALVQEGLNNIQKHARARHVQVMLKWSANDLRLQLVDDGVGFDPVTPPPYGHYGLAMMREQVKALSGMLVVESSPRQGTTLNFCIPLQR